jgi:hypothetical protein
MEDIEKARKLQRDCVEQHLIPPILGILRVDKINSENEIVETINQKSNSYVRNAYNVIVGVLCGAWATTVAQLPNTYVDGGVILKTETGTLLRGDNNSTTVWGSQATVAVGTGSTADTLNDFSLQAKNTTLTGNTMTRNGSWNAVNRTMTVITARTFINTNAGAIIVTEAGILAAGIYLILRDVFAPITLNINEGVTITYTLEIVFP